MIRLRHQKVEIVRLLSIIAPHKKRYLIGLLGACLVGSLVPLIMPMLIKFVIDANVSSKMESIFIVCAIFAIIILILGMLTRVFQYAFGKAVKLIMVDLRLKMFQKLEQLPISYYEQTHSGDSMSRINNDLGVVENAFNENMRAILSLVMTGIYAAALMFYLDWRFATALILFGLLTAYVNSKFITPLRKVSNTIQNFAGKQLELLTEITAGTQVSRIYQMSNKLNKQYEKMNDQMAATAVARTKKYALLNSVNFLMMWLNTIGAFVFGAVLLMKGQMTLGTLLSLVLLLEQVTSLFRNLGNYWASLQTALAGSYRVFEIFDLQPEIGAHVALQSPTKLLTTSNYNNATKQVAEEKVGNEAIEINEEKEENEANEVQEVAEVGRRKPHKMVELHNIVFGYQMEKPILNGLNLAVNKGELVALVGPSGSGKSTILKLLLGFYPIEQGEIIIAGDKLSSTTMERLRQQIAYVSQDAYLFEGTIEDNIRYGRMSATYDEVIAAAEAAEAHAFIMEQPEGYSTIVGERGAKLSGGQKQRITIARAILKNAPLLLLDEATSALDSQSEMAVQQALQKLMEGKTTIAIAHRLSTIRKADKIYVIENGKVVEEGKHVQLLELKGVYHRLYNMQDNNNRR
ncbi:ABC transporter ATP-binding protein [Paenibacillus yanchengensis]|uniref:ABC transporter ATP-binding protein n=1 Tax=Paenibacillus yanchengensis TaxID=2035833 RepID=A0ABW4YQ92_9BACL